MVDVAPGQHRVELFDVLGRKKVDEAVVVQEGRRHTFRWKSKAFENMGVHDMDGRVVEAAAPAPVPVRTVPVAVDLIDPDLGLDVEFDAAGLTVDVQGETRSETVNVGGLEIDLPKISFGRRGGRGRRN